MEHVCRDFRFSPPGSFEFVYRCTECGKAKDSDPWPCVGNGNAEDRAAGIPIGRM